MVHNIKDLFPEYVVLMLVGNFYDAYNGDANIISYLFKYKIRPLSLSDKVVGFPLVAYNKVIANLEKRCINYISIDKAHNYDEIDKMNYKKKNTYLEIANIANTYIDKMERIDKIRSYLLSNDNMISDVEKILYER